MTNKNENYLNSIKNLDEKFSFDQNYLKDIFFSNRIKGKYAWLRRWQLIVLSNWASVKLNVKMSNKIKKYLVLYCEDWNTDLTTSKHHFIERLAKENNKILYLEVPTKYI